MIKNLETGYHDKITYVDTNNPDIIIKDPEDVKTNFDQTSKPKSKGMIIYCI